MRATRSATMPRRTRAMFIATLIALSAARMAEAQANGKSTTSQGALPNGKPFQQIQSQFTQVQQDIDALQARVDAVEATLQTEINAIYERIGQMQGQLDTLADAVNALRQRVTDNETAIARLNLAIAALQAQLDSAQAQLAAQAGSIQVLANQVSALQTLITLHESQIASLQTENVRVTQFLTNLTNGSCQTGQAIRAVGSTGIAACSSAGASSGGALTSYTTQVLGYMLPNSATSMSVGCQAGYVVTGGGYVRPNFNEALPYVRSITLTPVVQASTGVLQRDPIAVLQSRTSSNVYLVQFYYAPMVSLASPYFEAWATCVKTS